MLIEDGKGNGNIAEVKDNQKLATESVSIPRKAYIADANELSFMFSTGGFITLTSGESAIMYIQYTGNGHLHIDTIRTCGTGVQKWKMYKQSTGGTIVSNAVAAATSNTNLSSSNQPSSTVYKGAQGYTQTGGTIFENWINNGGHSLENYDGTLILAKNDVLVLTCEVSSSIDVCARIICFEDAGSIL